MWWRVTGLGENQGAAITMETSIIIPKPKGNKQDRWTVMPKSCWTFSLLPMGWCITSTHKTKTLTEYHLEVIHQLCDAVWYKQLDLRATGTWQPCYNNVPLQFLGQKQHSSASSESISLDPAPCNLWLFSKLKNVAKSGTLWVMRRQYAQRTQWSSCTPFPGLSDMLLQRSDGWKESVHWQGEHTEGG